MGKATDLSGFDRGHTVVAQRLQMNIFEIARLVRCRQSAVCVYVKWTNDGETSSRRQGVGLDVYCWSSSCWMSHQRNRVLEIPPLGTTNRHQTVTWMTAQSNAGPNQVKRTLLGVGLYSTRLKCLC